MTAAGREGLRLALILCVGLLGLRPAAGSSLRSSSIAVTGDGRLLLAVNPDSDSLSILEAESLSLVAEVLVGDNPQSVAVSPEGARAYVTNRDDNTLAVVDIARARVIASIATADEPSGVVAGRDGRIYVASAGGSAVEVVEAATRAIVARVLTEPSPRGLALSAEGTRLYVTHFATGRLSIIDTRALRVERVISTVADSNLSNGIVLDESSQLAYLPQTRSNVSNRALLFDSTVFPIVSVVDLAGERNLPDRRIALDIADRPLNLPQDAVLTPGGKLYVVNAGSDGLSVLNARTGSGFGRIEVGRHPTGAALSPDGRTLFINNTLSGSVSVIDTSTDTVVREVPITEIPLARDVLNGKILFSTSARSDVAKDRWISCATCHFNAEADGRTWFFADGPRNTPSLLGVRDTLPIHWSGDLDELQDVESTIRRIQAGTGLAPGGDNCTPACDRAPPNAGRSRDLDDLAAYMRSVRPRPSPHLLPGGSLSPAAQRGRALFLSPVPGCAGCHRPPLYTDRVRHDVGTATSPLETKGSEFDTPSLRGIYKTAPYLHDGSAATLLDALTARNPDNRHGRTSQLAPSELAELVEFLRALPLAEEAPACLRGPERLCLAGGRFQVEMEWRNHRDGRQGKGQAIHLSDRSGAFWFFDPEIVELGVKTLDGGDGGATWLFYGGLSDVEYSLIVTDIDTGAMRRYHNPPGTICGRADTAAFALADSPLDSRAQQRATGTCAPGPQSLCLLAGRFRVEVEWTNPRDGSRGTGMALPGTDQSGYFWFFSRSNPELLVKVLDGRALTGGYWLFYAPLSDLEQRITVTDTATGAVRRYHQPAGQPCGAADLTAFAGGDP